DTGSTDDTIAVLKQLGGFDEGFHNSTTGQLEQTPMANLALLTNETWVSVPLAPITVKKGKWRNDFAWAREQSFAMMPADYDWAIWLDDDDVLDGAQNLRM